MTITMTMVLGKNKMSKEEYLAGNNDLRSFCVCRSLNLVILSSASSSSATIYALPPSLINNAKYSEQCVRHSS